MLAALRTTEGVSGWWGPATGSADTGGTFAVSFLGGRQVIRMHVEPSSERRVVWSVEGAGADAGLGGHDHRVRRGGDRRRVHDSFSATRASRRRSVFDMCHEGWTHYIKSLVSYVETGQGQPSREAS